MYLGLTIIFFRLTNANLTSKM